MSVKSKKSAKALDRPFAADTLAKARKIALQYQVILACEDGHWYGRGLELPSIHGDGKTVARCVENTREAFAGWVAYLLEEGQRPPPPAREATRTTQVNVRLTAEEKAGLGGNSQAERLRRTLRLLSGRGHRSGEVKRRLPTAGAAKRGTVPFSRRQRLFERQRCPRRENRDSPL